MPEWLEWVEHFIATVGFPIFVAGFLLWRDWKVGKQTNELLTELTQAVNKLCTRVDRL